MQQLTAQEKELLDIIRNSKDPAKTLEFALSLILELLTEQNAKNCNKGQIKDKTQKIKIS